MCFHAAHSICRHSCTCFNGSQLSPSLQLVIKCLWSLYSKPTSYGTEQESPGAPGSALEGLSLLTKMQLAVECPGPRRLSGMALPSSRLSSLPPEYLNVSWATEGSQVSARGLKRPRKESDYIYLRSSDTCEISTCTVVAAMRSVTEKYNYGG